MRLLAFLVSSITCLMCTQSALADRYGDIDFRVPAGWQKVENGGFAILAAPLDANGRPRAAIFITGGTTYQGDFRDWFRSAVIHGESSETSLRRGSVERIQSKGNYDALTIDSMTADRKGVVTHRKYVATNPGGKAELFVYVTYDDAASQHDLSKLREFLESVRYVQLGGVRREGLPRTAQDANLPVRQSASHCRVVTQQKCMSGMSGGYGGTMSPTYNCLPVSKTICN